MPLYVVPSNQEALQRGAEAFAAQLAHALQVRSERPGLELQHALEMTKSRTEPMSPDEFAKAYPMAAQAGLYETYRQSANELLRQKGNIEAAWMAEIAGRSAGNISSVAQQVSQQAANAATLLLRDAGVRSELLNMLSQAKQQLTNTYVALSGGSAAQLSNVVDAMARVVATQDANMTDLARAMLGALFGSEVGAQQAAAAATPNTLSQFMQLVRLAATNATAEDNSSKSQYSEAFGKIIAAMSIDMLTNSGQPVSVESANQIVEQLGKSPEVYAAVVRNLMLGAARAYKAGRVQDAAEYWLAARSMSELAQNKDIRELKAREIRSIMNNAAAISKEVESGNPSNPTAKAFLSDMELLTKPQQATGESASFPELLQKVQASVPMQSGGLIAKLQNVFDLERKHYQQLAAAAQKAAASSVGELGERIKGINDTLQQAEQLIQKSQNMSVQTQTPFQLVQPSGQVFPLAVPVVSTAPTQQPQPPQQQNPGQYLENFGVVKNRQGTLLDLADQLNALRNE
jgi:hypothetical protein